MPRKGRRRKSQGGGGRMVNISGPGGFALKFPIPRLPTWLGAANRLSANAAVYPRVDLDFPVIIQNVGVVAGACTTVINVDASVLIPNWSSRVQNLFREYCVVGLRLEHSLCVAVTAQGVVVVFVDETLATAPGAGSLFVPHMEVPLASSPDAARTQLLEYKPSGSYTDLDWTPVASPVTRQWVKYYASSGTGTAAGTAATITVRGTIAIAFRGYANF